MSFYSTMPLYAPQAAFAMPNCDPLFQSLSFRYQPNSHIPTDSPPPYSVAPPPPQASWLPAHQQNGEKNTPTFPTLVHHHSPSSFPEQGIRPPSTIRITKPAQLAKPSKPSSVPHPYARLFARKDEVKRRRIWNHAHEKSLFTPYELSTVRAPQRRIPYIASLEAHIDELHAVLVRLGCPIATQEELDQHTGLNYRTAKSKVSSLQHDVSLGKLKLLELERANAELQRRLAYYAEIQTR